MVPDKVGERRLIQLAQYISELFVITAAARKAAAIGLAPGTDERISMLATDFAILSR